MHILLIHQAFASLDEPGGTRHYELARYLTGRGHRITIIASPVSYLTGTSSPLLAKHPRRGQGEGPGVRGSPPPKQEPAGPGETSLTILRAHVYSAHHRSFFHRLIAFISFMLSSFFLGLRVQNVDLVWGTSPPIFQGLTAWALARLKRAPFLFEVRDLWPQFAIAVGVLRNPLLIRLAESLERFLYGRAARVLVNSPGFIEHVRGRGAKRVELVPNGSDPEMFDPGDSGRAFRESNGLQGKFVALYAGAHGMSNDLGLVLETARILQDSAGEIQIVLLGDGKEKPALQAAATGLGNVTFLDPVPKSRMPAALAGADACLAILKPLEEYKTTYPNKVFDYMAAGRPVVLAIDGAIREVVEAAGCGIFVEPGDAAALAGGLRALAADLPESRRMGSRGRAYLEKNFSRTRLAEKLAGILEEVAA